MDIQIERKECAYKGEEQRKNSLKMIESEKERESASGNNRKEPS